MKGLDKIKELYSRIPIPEPYKTALAISLATSTILGIAYVAMPEKLREKIKQKVFIKKSTKENNL
jgi:hypothetical protein